MLDRVMLEAILEQSGLEDSVLSFTANKTPGGGEATLHFSNSNAAAKCIRHFHGCRWTTAPVTAYLVQENTDDIAATTADIAAPPGLDIAGPPGLGLDENSNQA